MKRIQWHACLFFLAFISSGFGQTNRLQSSQWLSAGISFESWKVGRDQIAQFSVPFTVVYPSSDRFKLYMVTGPAFSNMKTGVVRDLGGLSDLKIGGHYLTMNDRWLFTFGLNAPTGKSAMNLSEYMVATVLAQPAFAFRIPLLGQGFDIQGGVSGAFEMGSLIFGLGVSFIMKGPFQPFVDQSSKYNPGDEITITAGFQKEWFTGDILYTLYTKDTWEGKKNFQSGGRLTIQLSSLLKMNDWDVTFFIRESLKGKNKTRVSTVLQTDEKNQNVNQLDFQNRWIYNTPSRHRIKGILDFKFYSNNEYKTGGALLFGLGGGADLQLSPKLFLNAELRYYLGNIVVGSKKVAASGIKFFGGIQVTL